MRKYRRELTELKDEKRINREAAKVMESELSKIKIEYTALIDAVNYLDPTEVEEEIKGLCTDGRKLFYNANYVLRPGSEYVLRGQIMHIIAHGLFGHLEKGSEYDNTKLAWDVMDLQVGKFFNDAGIQLMVIVEYDTSCHYPSKVPETDIEGVESGFSLYYRAESDKNLQKKIKKGINTIKKTFPEYLDDHTTWGLPPLKVELNFSGGGEGENGEKGKYGWIDISAAISGLGKDAFKNGIPKELQNALVRAIKESGPKMWGSESGGQLGEEVCAKEKGILDYSDLIDEVSVLTESSKEEDEIDPAIYEYGLSLYGDVPLIEPLEHKYEHKINSVVIAVDTSGSCGYCLNSFWTETLEIFRELESKGQVGKIHYLECDAAICYEKEYEGIEELNELSNVNHRFRGFGGTDFNPVFERIENYEKEDGKIDFLIYFSDGEGSYPTTEPEYPVYFVFPEKEDIRWSKEFRPEWVRTMVLDNNDKGSGFKRRMF